VPALEESVDPQDEGRVEHLQELESVAREYTAPVAAAGVLVDAVDDNVVCIEFSLGEPLTPVLPFDSYACWRAFEPQRPVVLSNPRSPIARSLLQLA